VCVLLAYLVGNPIWDSAPAELVPAPSLPDQAGLDGAHLPNVYSSRSLAETHKGAAKQPRKGVLATHKGVAPLTLPLGRVRILWSFGACRTHDFSNTNARWLVLAWRLVPPAFLNRKVVEPWQDLVHVLRSFIYLLGAS
jgi:hypothetical protein